MCEQCLTWPVSFGSPLPGYTLMRARRNGNDWLQGEWGLVECNDPTYIWKATPTPNPVFGMTDEEEEAFLQSIPEDSKEYKRANAYCAPDDFESAIWNSPLHGYRLVSAAIKRGYDPKDYNFARWLFDYLGEWLKTAPMEDEGDAFPSRESFAPVDLTIGRDPIEGEPEAT